MRKNLIIVDILDISETEPFKTVDNFVSGLDNFEGTS